MSQDSKLKPCPFCGGEAAANSSLFIENSHWVFCTRCSTDTNIFEAPEEAIETWNRRANEMSDGYHTFDELYHHRAILFSVICNQNKGLAWKAMSHADGTMYENMFIVGIETPQGQATYHYNVNPYWELFNVKSHDFAPEWDGHTPGQAIERIASLSEVQS